MVSSLACCHCGNGLWIYCWRVSLQFTFSTLGFSQGKNYAVKSAVVERQDEKKLRKERKSINRQLKELKKKDMEADSVKHLLTRK